VPGDHGGIRNHDLQIRSLTLYPTKLHGQCVLCPLGSTNGRVRTCADERLTDLESVPLNHSGTLAMCLEPTRLGFTWDRTRDLTIFSRAHSQLCYKAFVLRVHVTCINDGFRSRADERPTDLKSVPLNHSGTLTVYVLSPPASHDLDSNQGPTDLQSAALPLRHRESVFYSPPALLLPGAAPGLGLYKNPRLTVIL
jgi:hypothetical protein